MKVEGPRSIGAASAPRKANGTAGAGFSLPADSASEAASASGVRAVASLDSIMALQTLGFDPHRRGRQVRRGSKTLDALEALARAHLEGAAPHAERLMLVALQKDVERTGDQALDSVMDEIDVRAAVELAKLEMADRSRYGR
ncbi:MAG: flagellar assembly protein FliX [Pseudomonadota bacterium]